MITFMAVPFFDTGQFFVDTYLLLLPLLVGLLLRLLAPTRDRDAALLYKIVSRGLFVARLQQAVKPRTRKRRKKFKLKPVSSRQVANDATNSRVRTYLLPFAWTTFRLGCRVESMLRTLCLKRWRYLPCISKPHRSRAIRLALRADEGGHSSRIRFDSDSIPIGIDNHASRCLANERRLFEDLRPFRSGRVGGIEGGLQIEGQGTLVLDLTDDDGKPH